MRVLVCGGRNYTGDVTCLSEIKMKYGMKILIHGDAKGADTLARQWAESVGVHHAAVPALWDIMGKSAGYRRNTAMLSLEPDYCVAFPGGKGTQMMAELCEKKGITVWKPYG